MGEAKRRRQTGNTKPRVTRFSGAEIVDHPHPPGHVTVFVMHDSAGSFLGWTPVDAIDDAIADSAEHAAQFASFAAARSDKWQRLDRLIRPSATRNATQAVEDDAHTIISDVLWLVSHTDDGEKQARPLLEAKQECKVIFAMGREGGSTFDSAYVFPATTTAAQMMAYVRSARERQ